MFVQNYLYEYIIIFCVFGTQLLIIFSKRDKNISTIYSLLYFNKFISTVPTAIVAEELPIIQRRHR